MTLRTSIKFVLKRLRPDAAWRGLVILLSIVSAAVSLGIPAFAGLSLAELTGADFPGIDSSLHMALLGLAFLLLLRLVVAFVQEYSDVTLRMRANRRIQADFHSHILGLQFSDYQRFGVEVLFGASFFELNHLSNFVQSFLHRALQSVVLLFGSVFVMSLIAFDLTFALVIVGAGVFTVHRLALRKSQIVSAKYWKMAAKVREFALVDVSQLQLVRSFARDTERLTQFEALNNEALELGVRRAVIQKMLSTCTQIVSFGVIAGVVILAHTGVMGTSLEAASLVTFVLYAMLLTQPLRELGKLYQDYTESAGAIERVDAVLSGAPERRGGKPIENIRSIEFQNVFFGYNDTPVLHGLDLSIQERDHLGIKGKNGAGKTTLISLLIGLWSQDSGSILVNEKPLESIDLRSLRKLISVVTQHSELLDSTIRENLLFVRPDASEKDLQHALYTSMLEEFVVTLPEGLDTRIGHHGMQVSGGQRQRIALARAVLYDAPMVVLDEATSMFDEEAELEFVRRAQSWLETRTVIVISHRQTPLSLSDRIVNIEDGKILSAPATSPKFSA